MEMMRVRKRGIKKERGNEGMREKGREQVERRNGGNRERRRG